MVWFVFGQGVLSVVAQDTKDKDAQTTASAPAPDAAASAAATAAPAPTKQAPAINKDEYVIGNGDELYINVWKEPDLTRNVPVRPDGMITLPLVGDIKASGLTPTKLEEDLTKQLGSFVSNPSVTVTVQGVHSQKYNVVGEVQKPGTYELSGPPTTVLDAIATAGGLKDFAKSKKIYILRVGADGKQTRMPFNYKDVIKGEHMDQNIVLEPRDTIVVP